MTGGSWVDTLDSYSSGYIWTRDFITYSTGDTDHSTEFYNKVLTEAWLNASNAITTATNAQSIATNAIGIASTVAQHFWFEDDPLSGDVGAHITEVTKDEWKTSGSTGSNLLANTNGIAVRDGVD